MRILLSTIIPLVLARSALPQDVVELRGHVPAGSRAVISIPQLRTGTVAYEDGAFKLRFRPEAACYELLITSRTNERTVMRFAPPQKGRLDLGQVSLPKRRRSEVLLDHWPLIADTIGACVAAPGPWPEFWTAGYARVQGTITRGGRALRQALMDVYCHGAFDRVTTDSSGAFATDLTIKFPDDQALVDGQAACVVSHATESIDPPGPITIQFVAPDREVIVSHVAWTLPDPDFRPSGVVARAGDVMHPTLLGNSVAFRPGVLGALQFVRIALVAPPVAPVLYHSDGCALPPNADRAWGWEQCRMVLESPDTGFRKYLLPLAITVSTGHKQATTGSGIYLNLPTEYVDAIEAGGVLEVYSRVPLRYTSDSSAFVKRGYFYNGSIHLLKLEFIATAYDDDRSPLHEYEALFLIAVRPQSVGASPP